MKAKTALPTAPQSSAPETQRAPIWDVPIRLFHWLLVVLIAFSWWTGENHDMEWHRLSGYGILGLLIFRIYWGFVGGRTARFAQFVRGPRAILTYLRTLASASHETTAGHNPVGGWSVLAMLVTLAAMVVAGLFSVDVDGFESGPLADYVSFAQGRFAAHVHGFIFNLLLALVALHIVAVFFYLVRHRRNLIGPMIHGRYKVGAKQVVLPLRASHWRALLGVALAAFLAYAVSRGFRF